MKDVRDHYQTLFETAPISLVEADFTRLIDFIGDDAKTYLQSGSPPDDHHQDLFRSWARQVKCSSANKAALLMFESGSPEDLTAEQFLAPTAQAIVTFVSFIDSIISGKSEWSGYTEILKHVWQMERDEF